MFARRRHSRVTAVTIAANRPVLGKLKLLSILLAIPLLGYFVLGWVGSNSLCRAPG
jgi:hypothetical protein